MKKLVNLLVLIPIAVVLIVLSVTNRQVVTLGLDPFNAENPVISFSLPFFVFLLIALMIGVLIGGTITWFRQGNNRRELRDKRMEVSKLISEKEQLQNSMATPKAEFAPGLPVVAAE